MVSDSSKELVHLWLTDVWASQLGDSPPASTAAPTAPVSRSALTEAAEEFGEAAAEWISRGVAAARASQTEPTGWQRFLDPGPCKGSD